MDNLPNIDANALATKVSEQPAAKNQIKRNLNVLKYKLLSDASDVELEAAKERFVFVEVCVDKTLNHRYISYLRSEIFKSNA